MPLIDWSKRRVTCIQVVLGGILVPKSALFYFLLKTPGKKLVLSAGIGGLLVMGIALGIHQMSNPVLGALAAADTGAHYTVERGDAVFTVVGRGTLASADSAEVVCRLPGQNSADYYYIKWVIDDGTMVKKGDLLLELCNTRLMGQLVAQEDKVAEIRAEGARIREGIHLSSWALATRIPGWWADDVLAAETVRLRKLATDSAKSTVRMYAPRDGPVIYCEDPPIMLRRVHSGRSWVAMGETVRDGQKLVYIPDLSKMQVEARISEDIGTRVRRGQVVRVRVNAFANLQPLNGEVVRTARFPPRQDPLSGNMKRDYRVTIALADSFPDMRPGMDAEVCIEVGMDSCLDPFLSSNTTPSRSSR